MNETRNYTKEAIRSINREYRRLSRAAAQVNGNEVHKFTKRVKDRLTEWEQAQEEALTTRARY